MGDFEDQEEAVDHRHNGAGDLALCTTMWNQVELLSQLKVCEVIRWNKRRAR
jgi:hypothetical protein